MSKYVALWEYVGKTGLDFVRLSFDDAERIAGVPLDHSFLTYKKELTEYGYRVGKISVKNRTVEFVKWKSD